MTTLHHCVLSVAAMLLLTGSSAMAQTATTTTALDNTKLERIKAQDPATYVSEDQQYKVQWDSIRMSDISMRKRVWREIDIQQPENKIFAGNQADPSSMLANMLVNAVFAEKIKAYHATDIGGFKSVFTKDELMAAIVPGGHTDGKAGFNPEAATKILVKEDWLFLKAENKLVVRIVGIALAKEVQDASGKITNESLFWLYYPECRTFLASCKVNKGKGADDQNWDQVFETRKFKSTITKVTEGWGHNLATTQK
jgi:hypothetical protein